MQVRLATFNLENLGVREGDDPHLSRQWLGRHVQALRRTVEAIDADAVAFQELLDPGLLPPLIEGLGYEHVAVGERGSSPLLTGVFSRFPLRDPHPVAAGIDLCVVDRKTGIEVAVRGAFSRPALQVVWEVPAAPVTLIVVHWKSKIPSYTPARVSEPGGEPWESLGDAGEGRVVTEVKRLTQALQVRRVVDRHLRHDPRARLAVLGDFNDTLESEALRILMGDARACASPTLTPAELYPCEFAIPPENRYTQLYRGQREMIDHILVTRSLAECLEGARAYNEGLRETVDGPGFDWEAEGSDHAPLVATFRL
ncbi:MAG: endonuclease/exonuclease/phosphatase family protein [Deferrisomatales bacterium]